MPTRRAAGVSVSLALAVFATWACVRTDDAAPRAPRAVASHTEVAPAHATVEVAATVTSRPTTPRAAIQTQAAAKTCANDLATATAAYTNTHRSMMGIDAQRCVIRSMDGELWCGEGVLREIGQGWGNFIGLWGAKKNGKIDTGYVYALKPNGTMLVFDRHGDNISGSWNAGGSPIVLGGDFKTDTKAVAVGDDGWIFKLKTNGHLELWGAMAVGGTAGKTDGNGDGWDDGGFSFVSGKPRVIGTGWDMYDAIAAGPGNSIYARKPDGTLWFWQWGGQAWHNSGVPWKVGEGWDKFQSFAVSYEDIPAVIPANGPIPAKTTGVGGDASVYNHFLVGFYKSGPGSWGKYDKFLRVQAPDIKKGTWKYSAVGLVDVFDGCCHPATLYCTSYGNKSCGMTTHKCTEEKFTIQTTADPGLVCWSNAPDLGKACESAEPSKCTGTKDRGCGQKYGCAKGCTGGKNDYISTCGC